MKVFNNFLWVVALFCLDSAFCVDKGLPENFDQSLYIRENISVLYIDDTPTIRTLTERAFRQYNEDPQRKFDVSLDILSDGSALTAEITKTNHLILSDIEMPFDGNKTLIGMRKIARAESFSLPPFVAVTTVNPASVKEYHKGAYHLDANHRFENIRVIAKGLSFLFVRPKIKKEDIPLIFEECARLLGDDWLEQQKSRVKYLQNPETLTKRLLPKMRNLSLKRSDSSDTLDTLDTKGTGTTAETFKTKSADSTLPDEFLYHGGINVNNSNSSISSMEEVILSRKHRVSQDSPRISPRTPFGSKVVSPSTSAKGSNKASPATSAKGSNKSISAKGLNKPTSAKGLEEISLTSSSKGLSQKTTTLKEKKSSLFPVLMDKEGKNAANDRRKLSLPNPFNAGQSLFLLGRPTVRPTTS